MPPVYDGWLFTKEKSYMFPISIMASVFFIVVVIIVVLSTIVLFSAGKVIKNKTKDNTIKINLSSLKVAGEMYHNINGFYNNICLSDDFQRIKTAVLPIASGGVYNCISKSIFSGNGWAVCAALNRSSNSWCIDSRDVEMEISSSRCAQMGNIGNGSVYTCN
mgnify:CR=1 FL=1